MYWKAFRSLNISGHEDILPLEKKISRLPVVFTVKVTGLSNNTTSTDCSHSSKLNTNSTDCSHRIHIVLVALVQSVHIVCTA